MYRMPVLLGRQRGFDSDEISEAVACNGGQVTLALNAPNDAKSRAGYPELGRITGNTDSGEVEEHQVDLVTQNLAKTKTSDALTGQKKAGG